MTMQECATESRVEALKRVYVALRGVQTALRETAPNMRDYWSSSDFDRARSRYNERMEGVSRFMVAVTKDAQELQKAVESCE